MKPYIQISLSTGHVYEISSEVIANHRAAYYHGKLKESEFPTLESALKDSREYFADSDEIFDWAQNNMNPEDYLSSARLVRFTPPKQDFVNADWSAHEAQAISAELDGAQVLQQPVEAVMSAMAASRQICNITVLNGPTGAPFGAAVMVLGDNNTVGAFVTALQFTADQLTGGHIAAGQQAH